MNIPPSLKTVMQANSPYSWTDSNIPYLGLLLTSDPSKLAEANYT